MVRSLNSRFDQCLALSLMQELLNRKSVRSSRSALGWSTFSWKMKSKRWIKCFLCTELPLLCTILWKYWVAPAIFLYQPFSVCKRLVSTWSLPVVGDLYLSLLTWNVFTVVDCGLWAAFEKMKFVTSRHFPPWENLWVSESTILRKVSVYLHGRTRRAVLSGFQIRAWVESLPLLACCR